MSYLGKRIMRRARRGVSGLSGLSSRPFGPAISNMALGAYPLRAGGPAFGAAPDWYRAMQGAALGDDTATTGAATLTDGTAQWQAAMLATSQQVASQQVEYMNKETIQRWIQIAATLSIPVAAAVWRMIFRSGRGPSDVG